jgi:hypothetical protein
MSIRDRCSVNQNWDGDTFVGIKCEDAKFSVHFPLGFSISDDDKELRKDIILLLDTIASTTGKKESNIYRQAQQYNHVMFPVQAYMAVIRDYYERGYYKERETTHITAKRGKIDWNRTIKTQKTYVQNNKVFYLDYITCKNQVNEDELISLIHEYCVYESFCKIGWLFTAYVPQSPKIKLNKKLFRTILKQKIESTFNDRNRKLFKDMLAIVEYTGDNNAAKDYKYGTDRFEYVWESLIDKVYGIPNKDVYFPKTRWRVGGKEYENACLEPDTIMLWNGNVYVLDAKYYKYGMTRRPSDLPESTSINKQITYGEYIAEQDRFKRLHGDKFQVYNAFLMPFAAENEEIVNIGAAVSDWKSNRKTYEQIQGIVVDVKYLMRVVVPKGENELEKLAVCIESNVVGGNI